MNTIFLFKLIVNCKKNTALLNLQYCNELKQKTKCFHSRVFMRETVIL